MSEGAGVRIKRSIGTPQLDNLDPILLLDEIHSEEGSDYIAGFPDHPHRGFETVTYMLAGSMQHWDHQGNRGDLRAGSAQWMTAGRGIIHSEMPQQANGMLSGFQIWVNLPACDKMREPRYQDIQPESIPEIGGDNGSVIRVLAGEYQGAVGPISGIATEPLFFDVRLEPGATFEHPLKDGHMTFAYAYEGRGSAADGEAVEASSLVIFDRYGVLRLATESTPLRAIVLAAKPLQEPIARYGPFVMNTREEIVQAFQDYQEGKLTA